MVALADTGFNEGGGGGGGGGGGEGCAPPPARKYLGITNICIHEKCMDSKSCINLQT